MRNRRIDVNEGGIGSDVGRTAVILVQSVSSDSRQARTDVVRHM
jgi:hypothetical protein